jgi:hypothetical protein
MTNASRSGVVRRLDKLEAQMLPPPPRPTMIMNEPGADATPDERQAFDDGRREAVAGGAKVWVVVASGNPADRDPVPDVTFVDVEWKAQLGILARTEGGLEMLWKRLSGDVLRPDGAATEPDLEAVPGDRDEPDLDELGDEAEPARAVTSSWRSRLTRSPS